MPSKSIVRETKAGIFLAFPAVGIMPSCWEEGNTEWLLNEYGISFWLDENVLEIDRADNCTTLNIVNATICTF